MCVLINEPDESQFLKLKVSFLLQYSHQCPVFKDYLEDTFLPKGKKWTNCYRQEHHVETDTTMLCRILPQHSYSSFYEESALKTLG